MNYFACVTFSLTALVTGLAFVMLIPMAVAGLILFLLNLLLKAAMRNRSVLAFLAKFLPA